MWLVKSPCSWRGTPDQIKDKAVTTTVRVIAWVLGALRRQALPLFLSRATKETSNMESREQGGSVNVGTLGEEQREVCFSKSILGS